MEKRAEMYVYMNSRIFCVFKWKRTEEKGKGKEMYCCVCREEHLSPVTTPIIHQPLDIFNPHFWFSGLNQSWYFVN